MEKSDLSLFGIESIERMEKNILIMAISESATEQTPMKYCLMNLCGLVKNLVLITPINL